MPSFSTISHLDLTVSDAERSAAWYVDTLGLRRARRSDLDNRIMIVLVHPATGLVIVPYACEVGHFHIGKAAGA